MRDRFPSLNKQLIDRRIIVNTKSLNASVSDKNLRQFELFQSMQCIENTKAFTTTITTSLAVILTSSTSLDISNESEDTTECVWRRGELSAFAFGIYAFVVPSLAFFGLCANFINAIVFMRPKMTPSAFTYLASLSWLDCISCLLITLTAFSRR